MDGSVVVVPLNADSRPQKCFRGFHEKNYAKLLLSCLARDVRVLRIATILLTASSQPSGLIAPV